MESENKMTPQARAKEFKRILDLPPSEAKENALTALALDPRNQEAGNCIKNNPSALMKVKYGTKGDDKCMSGNKEACKDWYESTLKQCPKFFQDSRAMESAPSDKDKGGIPTWVWYSIGGLAAFYAYRHFTK